jgi:hypothetical protein
MSPLPRAPPSPASRGVRAPAAEEGGRAELGNAPASCWRRIHSAMRRPSALSCIPRRAMALSRACKSASLSAGVLRPGLGVVGLDGAAKMLAAAPVSPSSVSSLAALPPGIRGRRVYCAPAPCSSCHKGFGRKAGRHWTFSERTHSASCLRECVSRGGRSNTARSSSTKLLTRRPRAVCSIPVHRQHQPPHERKRSSSSLKLARPCARVCTRHDTQSAQRILHRFRILPLDPSGVCVRV